MQRRLLAFGGAIALLLVGSLALIHRVTAPPPDAASASRAAAPAAPRPAGPGALPLPSAPPGGSPLPVPSAPVPPPPPILPPEAVPAPVPTPPPAWMEGSTASLGKAMDPTPLGPLRPFVASGMGKLQLSVAECAREAPPGASAEPGGRRTTLTLHIESLDNQLRIVDATPPDAASSTDWRVQCAQRKLRGQLIPAPSRKGSHFEVPFVLNL